MRHAIRSGAIPAVRRKGRWYVLRDALTARVSGAMKLASELAPLGYRYDVAIDAHGAPVSVLTDLAAQPGAAAVDVTLWNAVRKFGTAENAALPAATRRLAVLMAEAGVL